MKLRIFILLLIMLNAPLYGQSYINVQAHFNYWQHTDVYGPGIGFGYSYKFKKLNLSLNYDFGYGMVNRFKDIDNINYNNWSTVFIKEQKGKWNEYLGYTTDLSNELKGTSDYGKQHQISIHTGYSVLKRQGMELCLVTGFYAAIVEHFYTFTNVPIYYIEIPATYSGSLNYIPATSQKIYTYGINFELSLNKLSKNKVLSPYIICGLGPNYGSYISLGFRMSTLLLKKKN